MSAKEITKRSETRKSLKMVLYIVGAFWYGARRSQGHTEICEAISESFFKGVTHLSTIIDQLSPISSATGQHLQMLKSGPGGNL